jgi:hypothetical protein
MAKKPLKKSAPLKKRTVVQKITDNQRLRKGWYRILRDVYFLLHPTCEICHRRKGTSLHHKAGRKGFNLFRYFMSLCRECHNWIHYNSKEATRLGYLVEANPKEEDPDKAIL